MSEINFGAISEALNDKTDRDMRNVDTAAKADAVIDFQVPTAENNYRWYRKYASGWVEQGGAKGGYDSISGNVMTKNLMIAMQTPYTASIIVEHGQSDTGAYWARMISESDSTHLKYYMYLNNTVTTNNPLLVWKVEGMAA